MTSQHSLGHYCWLHNDNFVFFSAQNLEIITTIYHQWWSFVWWQSRRRNRNFNMACCYSSSSTRTIWEKARAFSSVSCIAFENMMIEPTGLNPSCTKYKIQSPATCLLSSDWCLLVISKALFQYLIRHLIISSSEVSKPWDLCLKLSSHPEIWPAPSSNAAEAPVKYQSFVIIWTTNFAALNFDEILW